MVATDVASRGIGMIANPLSFSSLPPSSLLSPLFLSLSTFLSSSSFFPLLARTCVNLRWCSTMSTRAHFAYVTMS